MVSRSFVNLVISVLAIATLAFAAMHNPSAEDHRAELRATRDHVGVLGPGYHVAGFAAYHSLRFASYTTDGGRVVSIGLFGIVFVSSVVAIQVGLAIGALLVATGILRVAAKRVHLAKPFWDRSARSLKPLSNGLKALPHGYWFFISLVLYVLSLLLPFAHGARGDGVLGWLALMFGWIYLFGESLAWLANPMLFLTWLLLLTRLPRTAVIFASIALLSAVPFIFGPILTVGWGGVRDRLTPNIGYFLWLGSILAGLFSAIRLESDARRTQRSAIPAPDTGPRRRIRVLVGWWTVVTWAVCVALFLPSFPFHFSVWAAGSFVVGLAGLVGGVMALRDLRGWRPLLCTSYSLVIVWSLAYLVGLVQFAMAYEEAKTVSQALFRIGRDFIVALSEPPKYGDMLSVIAALYGYILMPALHILAAFALLTWAALGRTSTPNNTVETDARESGARGSP